MAPLLEQLKNFIRHGKSGKDMKPRDSGTPTQSPQHSSSKSKSRSGSRNPSPSRNTAAAALADQQNHATAQAANAAGGAGFNTNNTEAASRIVAEEKQQKSKMPYYPGLERYKLVEKMGE